MRRSGPLRALAVRATATTLTAGWLRRRRRRARRGSRHPRRWRGTCLRTAACAAPRGVDGREPRRPRRRVGQQAPRWPFSRPAATGSCTAYWNGASTQPIAEATFGGDIATIQAHGGNVVPSFGGYSADTTWNRTGRQLHRHRRHRLGLRKPRQDLRRHPDRPRHRGRLHQQHRRDRPPQQGHRQGGALGRTDRPQRAVLLHSADHRHGPRTQRRGAAAQRRRQRRARGRRQHHDVRLLDGATHDMAADTRTATSGLHDQLAALYPKKNPAQLWHVPRRHRDARHRRLRPCR